MKNILREMADILYDVPLMDQDIMIGILNPFDSKKQAQTMLNYLKENKDNPEAMRIDTLIRTALWISDTV